MNRRNPLVTKFEHTIWRPMMLNYLYDKLDLVLLAEFPKCGGTWVSQMISEYLEIPYPRNQVPNIERSLMHGHYFYKNTYAKRSFVVTRDGRDVMVSWYHHCLFDTGHNHFMVERVKKDLCFKDIEDVRGNMPKFIEYCFETKRPIGMTWVDFLESWMPHVQYIIRYEKLLEDAVGELARAFEKVLHVKDVDQEKLAIIVEKYSFKNLTGRKQGDESKSSFLRKGISGDWVNYFTPESQVMFHQYAGDMLIQLGYENDSSWIVS